MGLTPWEQLKTMDEDQLREEAEMLLDTLEQQAIEANSYIKLDPGSLSVNIDYIENVVKKIGDVCHLWNGKINASSKLSRSKSIKASIDRTQKLYRISYAFSDLNSEGIPSFYDDVDYLYAYSEEDAEKKFEENLREDYGVDEHGHIPGYEGCDVNEATPEEVEKHEFWTKNTDRRDEAIAYVTKKVRELGIPESQVSDYVDMCVEVLEDYYAFDDIPEWVDAGCDASYWVDWETRNLFESGFPDNIIEEICSGATTVEDEESTVYL